MTRRRWLLVGGLAALVASAAQPAIGAPLDVEAGGYGGAASGGWACGPNARVKYGGAGGEVRVHGDATKDEPEHGFAASAGGAIEDRAFDYLGCGEACGNDPPPDPAARTPRGGAAFGAVARGGYDWRWFGFRAGANVWQTYPDDHARGPTTLVFPSLVLRGGELTGLHFDGGFGSYDVPTIARPGLFAGVYFVPAVGWEVALHGGVHQTFDGSGGARGALALKLPLSDVVQIGAGLALSEGADDRVEPEGQGMLVVHVW